MPWTLPQPWLHRVGCPTTLQSLSTTTKHAATCECCWHCSISLISACSSCQSCSNSQRTLSCQVPPNPTHLVFVHVGVCYFSRATMRKPYLGQSIKIWGNQWLTRAMDYYRCTCCHGASCFCMDIWTKMLLLSDSSRVTSFVPMLTEGNFQKWAWAIKAYLMPHNHIRVIKQTKDSGGKLHDPIALTDAKALEVWNQSERMAIGIIAARSSTSTSNFFTSTRTRAPGPCGSRSRLSMDASLCHSAWMGLLGIHQDRSGFRTLHSSRIRQRHILPLLDLSPGRARLCCLPSRLCPSSFTAAWPLVLVTLGGCDSIGPLFALSPGSPWDYIAFQSLPVTIEYVSLSTLQVATH